MDSAVEKQRVLTDVKLVKPNVYAATTITGIMIIVLVVGILNSLGLFELNRSLVTVSFFLTLILFAVTRIIVGIPKINETYASKYVIMMIVMITVLELSVLLNIHVTLALVLPMLLAPQYRSLRVTRLAVASSFIVCAAAPIFSYFFRTWDYNYLSGYLETACNISILSIGPGVFPTGEVVVRILLYLVLPQSLVLALFSVIVFGLTRNEISSLNNQLKMLDMSNDIIYSMSDIIESRDGSTGDHVRRTSEIVRIMVEAMKADPECDVSDWFCASVVKASPMHDVGKIAIDDAILRKPGRLTPDEYEVIKTHSVVSEKLIEDVFKGIESREFLALAKNLARYHHERYDGKGYPDGLAGDAIPLEARIMAIADVYDALVSTRCYKEPMGADEAFRIIEDCMGTQFDPGLNKYFISCRDKIEQFYKN